MTRQQSEQLREGDRVFWKGDTSDAGTVIEHGWAAVRIKWDNGQVGTIAHDDMWPHSAMTTNANFEKGPAK